MNARYRFESATASVAQAIDDGDLVGAAVGIVFLDGETRLAGFGCADRGTGRAVDAETLFWIASVTKPMTATMILILEEQGVLRVDEPAPGSG